MIATDVPILCGVGVLAGVVSTVVSLASVVSYPALLALGLPPLTANVTNTVALVFTAVGATAGSQRELAGQRGLVLRLGLLTALGGATGAALLLLTPSRTFELIAPWLVAGASLALLAQHRIGRTVAGSPAGGDDGQGAGGGYGAGGRDGGEDEVGGRRGEGRLLRFALFSVAIYTGYFGAAGGILTLAVLAAMIDLPLVRVNAVKNVVAGLANGVAAAGFAFFGPVRWTAVVPLAAGFLAGGWIGPALVRRLPGQVLRMVVAVCGVAVAVKLGIDGYR